MVMKSKPETGLTAAQKLIEDKAIIMLTGEYSSSCTYPIAGLAQKNKIPFMVSCAAADKITQSGWTYVFRMDQPASEFDSGLQEFLLAVAKPKSMVVLYENTLFGTSVAKIMKSWAEAHNIDVPIFEDYEAGVVDFKAQCDFEGKYFQQAQQLATLELNAIIDGALEAGATEIYAWPGHENFPGGINVELVHPK